MKKSELFLVGLVIIFLSIHLFTVHSKLLFHLNPDNTVEYLNYKFSIDLFKQNMIVPTLSAIAYSLITALILSIFVKFRSVFLMSVISFAILDGAGVFIYYNVGINKQLFILMGSVYYSFYTIFIIISLGLFRNLSYKNSAFEKRIDNAIIEEDVIQLRETMNNIANIENIKYPTLDQKVLYYYSQLGTQQKVAKKLGINQTKVSRILAKHKNTT